jgi:hypothetical protein
MIDIKYQEEQKKREIHIAKSGGNGSLFDNPMVEMQHKHVFFVDLRKTLLDHSKVEELKKSLHLLILLFIPLLSVSQVDTCNVTVCGTANLSSTFDSTFTHIWTCSDGNTSTSPNPSFTITGNTLCVLTVEGPTCNTTRSIYVRNCPDTCILQVTVGVSGTNLLASTTNCEGTATYQWQRWNGSSWENVGVNSSTYNTGGTIALYKVIVNCGFGCSNEAEFDYDGCNFSILSIVQDPISSNNALVTLQGCNDYRDVEIYREVPLGSNTWVLYNSYSTGLNVFSLSASLASGEGYYRIEITSCGCTRTGYYFKTTNPCGNFVSSIAGPTTACTNASNTYTATSSGGGGGISVTWSISGSVLGTGNTFNHTFTSSGTYIVVANFTSAGGCTSTRSTTVIVNDCCSASNSLTPSSISICTNQSTTLTTSATTGTSPYTFAWTYSNGGAPISLGSGTTKAVSFPTTGTYSIVATMTDATGCVSTASSTVTVTACLDCNCTPSLANVGCNISATFLACTGYSYILEYSLTGSSWSTVQSGTISNFTYAPTANGLYRLTATKSGCETQISNIVNITCYVAPCSNNPTVTLTESSRTACNTTNQVISGNTIGGSATTVTATENGAGTVAITWQNSTTFRITYTPASGDIGNLVTIVITTNNPNGAPCIAATATLGITFVNPITPTITSSASTMCWNTQRNITVTPLGGSLTVSSGPGVLVGNILTATAGGNIYLDYSYTSMGCTQIYTQIIPVIQCTPTLALSGCELEIGATGSGCGAFTYNLEYSVNGSSGWSTVQSGVAVFTGYTPTNNGFYRVRLLNANCPDVLTSNVQVSCVLICDCIPSTLLSNSCELSWGGCSGYTATLQRNTGSWANVTTTSPYTFTDEEDYRVLYTKSGCPNQTSNTVTTVLPPTTATVTYTQPYILNYSDILEADAAFFGGQDSIDIMNLLHSYKCNGDLSAKVFLFDPSVSVSGVNLNTATMGGNSITTTFTSDVPVTWLHADALLGRPEFEVISQTSTSITFRTAQNPGFPPVNTPRCSTGTNRATRVKSLIEARNACGELVWSAWVHWWGAT